MYYGMMVETFGVHTRKRRTGLALAGCIIVLVTVFGFIIRHNQLLNGVETALLRYLGQAPQWMHGVSTVIAHSFSTIGCFVFLGIGAVLEVLLLRHYYQKTSSMQCAVLIRRTVLADILVAFAPMLYVMAVKWIVMRPRPITSVGNALLPWDPSFPSGHTSVASLVAVMVWLITAHWKNLATAGVRAENADKNIGSTKTLDGHTVRLLCNIARTISVILVLIVACSRLILGLHYPTDVLTAAVAYPLLAYAVWLIVRSFESR